MASIMEMEDNSGMMKVYLPTFKENTRDGEVLWFYAILPSSFAIVLCLKH